MAKSIDIVLLCGGEGTRLGSLTQKTPKPLLKINDAPFLLHLLLRLKKEGFESFVLAVRHLSDQFHDFLKEYQTPLQGLKIRIVVEETPLGTGGALRNAARTIASPVFIALNGDSLVNQELLPVLDFHTKQESVFTLVAVSASKVEGGTADKGGLVLAEDGTVLNFQGHQSQGEQWVNGGLYVMNRDKILSWPSERYDLEERLESLLAPDKAKAFCSDANLLDIGKPACFEGAAQKLKTWENNQWN